MDAGNEFLPGFLERFNEKFALPTVRNERFAMKLNVQACRLTDVLCHRELRHVSQQLSSVWLTIAGRSCWGAEGLRTSCPASMSRSTTLPIGRLRSTGKGHSLPYRVFSKDWRVSHTAIIENKRLSHALATVKDQQDQKRLK